MTLLNGSTTTTTGGWVYKDSPNATFQAVVTGSGTVSATVEIDVSNDGTYAVDTIMGSITLSGTDANSDGFTSQNSPWKYVRARVTAISGTSAAVTVHMGV